MYCISSGIVLSHSKVTVDICSKLEGFQLVTAQRYFTPTQRSNFPTENFRSPPWKKKKRECPTVVHQEAAPQEGHHGKAINTLAGKNDY